MIASLLAALALGPTTQGAVRYSVDNIGGGHNHRSGFQRLHSWPDGLCPSGEIWVNRTASGQLLLKGYDGLPRLRRDCDTGAWLPIEGKTQHGEFSIELKRKGDGAWEDLRASFEFRIPRFVAGASNYRGDVLESMVDRVELAHTVAGQIEGERLRLVRAASGPANASSALRNSLEPAETRNVLLGAVDLMVGDPERLRRHFGLLREGKKVPLKFLETDLKLHDFTLIGLGCQTVIYKNWTRILFRAVLESNGPNPKRYANLWLDSEGKLQLGEGALPFDLAPTSGFVSPTSAEFDNGRPWPVFVPPTTFVPAPPEFKPPTDGDGGEG